MISSFEFFSQREIFSKGAKTKMDGWHLVNEKERENERERERERERGTDNVSRQVNQF